MLKKTLIAIAVVALLAVSAIAVPPVPCDPTDGFIAQCEVPVCMLIDKYAEITVLGDCLILHEKPGEYWEGSTMVNIVNNWTVFVRATIEPYFPNISKSSHNDFLCMLEGDPAGLNDNISELTLHPYPYPDGYTLRLWAGIHDPDLLARASNPEPQRVATIYLTVQN